jgi:A/G-specific adenine glycosylase
MTAKTKPSNPSPPLPDQAECDAFRQLVYGAARDEGRHFPWRETEDPYRILVSEVMLQQTQADRVADRFNAFLGRFPDLRSLAIAELADVLSAWQGLGYNRRALNLQRSAALILQNFGGKVPDNPDLLATLPGIGPYTAGAITAFAFDRPVVFIETNIRTVFIHHFHGDRLQVHDRDILPLVAATLDRNQPRLWYNALMDYGVLLKRNHANPSRRSAHHGRQSPFAGSNRQQRSLLLKLLLATPGMEEAELAVAVSGKTETVINNLRMMEREGILAKKGKGWRVA